MIYAYCHEMALRIVLADLNRQASKYKRYIVFALPIVLYIRIVLSRSYPFGSEASASRGEIQQSLAAASAGRCWEDGDLEISL